MHRNWIVSDPITVRGLLFPAEIHCDGWVWGGSCSHSFDNQKSGQKGHGTSHHVAASVIDHPSFYRLEFIYFSFHTWQLVVWVWHVMTLRGELLSSWLPLTHYDPTPPSITGTGHFDTACHSALTRHSQCQIWDQDWDWALTDTTLGLVWARPWDTEAFTEPGTDYDLNYLLWGGDKISRSWHRWWFYWAQMLNGVSGDLNSSTYFHWVYFPIWVSWWSVLHDATCHVSPHVTCQCQAWVPGPGLAIITCHTPHPPHITTRPKSNAIRLFARLPPVLIIVAFIKVV